MNFNCVLVKLSPEISLKTAPVRVYFLNKLVSNIKELVLAKEMAGNKFVRGGGRLYIFPDEKKNIDDLCIALTDVFGVSSVAPCKMVLSKSRSEVMDAAFAFALEFIKPGDTFAVRLKNTLEKSFSSREFEATLGSKILSKIKNLKVNLDNPGKKLSIEIGPKGCFLYMQELQGLGGLPLGCEGNVAVFFEGKKEELVAAFLMMKRGCNVFPVMEKLTPALSRHVNKLCRWNSFRAFRFSDFSELSLLKENPAISVKAIVFADKKFGKKMTEEKKQFDGLGVFWPLALLPETQIKKLLKVVTK